MYFVICFLLVLIGFPIYAVRESYHPPSEWSENDWEGYVVFLLLSSLAVPIILTVFIAHEVHEHSPKLFKTFVGLLGKLAPKSFKDFVIKVFG